MFRKILSSFLFLFLFVQNADAAHIKGAEIDWECVGNGDYIFRLTLFLDCSGSNAAATQFIQGPAGSIACNISQGSVTPFNGTCSSTCIEERWEFVSDTISFTGVPPSSGWEFSYSVCCRGTEVNLNGIGAIYAYAKMYPYQPVGGTGALSADSCYNHSPKFLNRDPAMHCEGPYSYNHQISDREQDSIVAEFATPLGSSGNPISFATGYDYDMPFPDSTENPLNGRVTLDPQSGLMQMEFYDPIPGNYQSVLLVKEYRDGQLISEIMRDRPMTILDSVSCAQANANNRPNLSVSSNNNLILNQVGGHYAITAQQGDTIDLNILASDFDFNSAGISQTICFTAQSNFLNPANYGLSTGCANGNCATITPIGSNGYCGSVVEDYHFQWTPDCSVLTSNSSSAVPHIFHFETTDNGCPLPKSRQATLIVYLYPSSQSAVQVSLASADTIGTANINWTRLNLNSGVPFDKYKIHVRPIGGTFVAIDSIYDIDSTSATYSNLPFPCEIYVEATSGSCPTTGPASNVINTSVALNLMAYSKPLEFSISPNPAGQYISLELANRQDGWQNLEARLYSASGQLMQVYPLGDGLSRWDLQIDQKPGLYIIELRDGNFSSRSKLIIE